MLGVYNHAWLYHACYRAHRVNEELDSGDSGDEPLTPLEIVNIKLEGPARDVLFRRLR